MLCLGGQDVHMLWGPWRGYQTTRAAGGVGFMGPGGGVVRYFYPIISKQMVRPHLSPALTWLAGTSPARPGRTWQVEDTEFTGTGHFFVTSYSSWSQTAQTEKTGNTVADPVCLRSTHCFPLLKYFHCSWVFTAFVHIIIAILPWPLQTVDMWNIKLVHSWVYRMPQSQTLLIFTGPHGNVIMTTHRVHSQFT